MSDMKYKYEWKLQETKFAKKKGKVFSCFACGGGSTMGYKLAGFDVIGCNEIDPKMIEAYRKNHNPKYSYLEPIQSFKLRNDLPKELYELDILDGSPPCSSFSMAGNREADWGKEKNFREGQAKQILDTLFFDFIELGKKLQPKVIIAENVKGLLLGEAKKYVVKIYNAFNEAGYMVNHWLLDSSAMGVPQRRQRVFFVAVRKDLEKYIQTEDIFGDKPYINMQFTEKPIPYKQIEEEDGSSGRHIPAGLVEYWKKVKPGRALSDAHEKGYCFQEFKLHPNKPLPTLRAGSNSYYHYNTPRRLHDIEIKRGGSFPLDYDFCGNPVIYLVGMSVPPVMTAKIADRVAEYILDPIKEKQEKNRANTGAI